MKRIFVLVSFSFLIWSCNSNSGGNETSGTVHEGHGNHSNAKDTGNTNHMQAMHEAMNTMMQHMKDMKPTGDADYDFAMMMKHHHQGAVDMVKAELGGGNNDGLKAMAQKMLDDQQREINEFDQFLNSHKPAGNSDYGQKAMSMMTEMGDMNMQGGSVDAMFASMMIPHHQDGIDMAEEYLKVAKDENLKNIARNIVDSQKKEIGQLQEWLKNNR